MKIRKNIYELARRFAPPSLGLNVSRKIEELLETVGKGAKVLDAGSGKKRISAETINIDIGTYLGVDIVGKVQNLPFKDGSFDLVVARAILEHVEDPSRVVAELRRVLKRGGYIYAEIPFLQPYHGAPGDFQRYTITGIEELFKDFKRLDSGVCVGPTSAILAILQEYIAFAIGIPIVRGAVYYMLGWIFQPFKYLDLVLAKRRKAHVIASSLYYIGKNEI